MGSIRVLFSEKNAAFVLFLVALAAHLAVFYSLMYLYGPCSFFLSNDCSVHNHDTQHYVVIAKNIVDGNGYSRFVEAPFELDALRTPLLPLYFVPFVYFGGYGLVWLAMLFLNIALSLAAPVAYKIARFFLSHRLALAAGFFIALEPLYLYRSQIAEPDAILVLLFLASIFFVLRSWHRAWFVDFYRAAFLLGLAVLAKPSALYLAIIIFFFHGVHLYFFGHGTGMVRAKSFAVAALIAVGVVFPWLVRNAMVFGTPAISSIQGYNLYEYYTVHLKDPAEKIPEALEQGSREPSRYLPYQSYFTGVALERIKNAPISYAREQLIGTLRNAFVSDISQIVYYGHARLLPFAYNPESRVNLHERLLAGDFRGFLRELSRPHVYPKVLWIVILGLVYSLAVMGWVFSWRAKKIFLALTMFATLYGYLLLASGPFVDAKYRLPALELVVVAALYGLFVLYNYVKKKKS